MSDGKQGQARAIGMTCMVVAGLCAGAARADDAMIPGGQETFTLNLGGILATNSTSLRLDGTGGRGTDLNLEDLLGVKDSTSSFFATGTWRFAPKHRLGITGFTADRDHTKVIDRTITIGDNVIPINTSLKTETKTQFFIVNYQYSFIRNEDWELAGILGLYGANYKYKFTAATPVVNIDKSTTAPLPVIGLSADFFLTPRWSATVFGEGLKAKVGDIDGSIYYVGITTDYMLTRNWGVGLGYQLADIRADSTKDSFNGHISWRMDGYFAYVAAKF